jgi:probable rRNA maturation factor
MSPKHTQQSICNVYQTVASIGISKKTIQEIVFFVLGELGISGSVSITFVGEMRMRTLNRSYRGKDRVTDVLSFAAQEGDMPLPHTDLGDMFIAPKQIARQAKMYAVPYKEEMARMIVHGVLHLLGYDHERPRDAKKMFALQNAFLEHICNGDVYGKT